MKSNHYAFGIFAAVNFTFFNPNKFPYVYWPEGFTFAHIVLSIAYVSFVAVLLYWVIRLLKKFEALKPPLENKKYIYNFLNEAYLQDIFFEGYIPVPGRLAFWDIRAKLSAIDKKFLIFKTNIVMHGWPAFGEIKYVDALVGREFRGRIEIEGVLYEFRSLVASLEEKKHQIYLRVPMPKELSVTTKRFQRRLLIDDHLDLSGILWFDIDTKNPPIHINDVKGLKNQYIAFKKNQIQHFTLIDLSARGMKIRFNNTELDFKNLNITRNATCLFSLSLVQLDTRKVTRMWLLLECRHVQHDNNDIVAGFFILKYAMHSKNGFEWILNESEGGVEEIQDWIVEIRDSQERSMR